MEECDEAGLNGHVTTISFRLRLYLWWYCDKKNMDC